MNTTTPEVYQDIELTTEVMNASEHRLIQMLMVKCLQKIRLAKTYITKENLKQKHKAINHAADIIAYLRTCLNFEDPTAIEMSKLLDSIYEYLAKSLLAATLKNDVQYLELAEKALANIKLGWDGIAEEDK